MKNITELPSYVETFECLLAYLADSRAGYLSASQQLSERLPQAKATIETILSGRQALQDQLSDLIESPGVETNPDGTLAGAAHRTLLKLKDTFSSNDDGDAIVEEIVRGEETLVEYIDKNFDLQAALDNPVIRVVSEIKSHALNSILAVRNLSTFGI